MQVVLRTKQLAPVGVRALATRVVRFVLTLALRQQASRSRPQEQGRRRYVPLTLGVKRVEDQHKRNKLTARERINLLFDKGTFTEYDAFVTHRCHDFGMEKTK